MKRKICFFTGSRAEFGIMHDLMHRVANDENCQLQIVATNMHLSPEFGLTYREIEADGLNVDKKVEMLLSSDTSNGIVKSMGLGMIGFADALEDLQPDLAIILGDRYEMLAAAAACLIYKVPIAHLGGGDITEGAYDNAIRHSISKMSSLHCARSASAKHEESHLSQLFADKHNLSIHLVSSQLGVTSHNAYAKQFVVFIEEFI